MSIFCFSAILGELRLFLARIPIYFVGLYWGYKMRSDRLPLITLLAIAVTAYLLLGGRVLSSLGLNFVLLFFVVPGLVVGLTWIFESMERLTITRKCNQVCQYLGTLSLEVYFTHGYIIGIINQYQIKLNWAFFIVLSVLSAIVLKYAAKQLLTSVRLFARVA